MEALKNAGCEKFYQDQLSGARLNRPGLEAAINDVRKEDTLVVWKLDRLGHTVKGLIELVNQLHEKGSHFKSITDNIDTSSTAYVIWMVTSIRTLSSSKIALNDI